MTYDNTPQNLTPEEIKAFIYRDEHTIEGWDKIIYHSTLSEEKHPLSENITIITVTLHKKIIIDDVIYSNSTPAQTSNLMAVLFLNKIPFSPGDEIPKEYINTNAYTFRSYTK